jgi:hypothetical protein
MPPNSFNVVPSAQPRPVKKSVNIWLIISILEFVLIAVLAGLLVWLYLTYDDLKTNFDSKTELKVSAAKAEVRKADEIKFIQREKEPYRGFVGPTDYGRVTFDYPKTWSVYIYKDASKGGTYEAYLNPITVPSVSNSQQFAARVVIEQKDYDKAIASYNSLVKKGDLKAKSIKVNNITGTRLDGSFTKDIRGSAVLFKIRDKTLTVRTDANAFMSDFNRLITTIKFNQ